MSKEEIELEAQNIAEDIYEEHGDLVHGVIDLQQAKETVQCYGYEDEVLDEISKHLVISWTVFYSIIFYFVEKSIYLSQPIKSILCANVKDVILKQIQRQCPCLIHRLFVWGVKRLKENIRGTKKLVIENLKKLKKATTTSKELVGKFTKYKHEI